MQVIEAEKVKCHVAVAILRVMFEGPLILRHALREVELPNFSAPFDAGKPTVLPIV
jgi:hypothetical protein